MDKLKAKTRSARNRLAEATSSGSGRGELHVPHQALAPHDNSSTHAVNEGFQGQPQTAARDFAVPESQPTVLEPPTSLQSSIDAGAHVPKPSRYGDPTTWVSHRYRWIQRESNASLTLIQLSICRETRKK